MANTTRPNISDAGVKKLEKYKANRIAEGYTGYQLDEVMDQAYQYVLNNEKREKEEEERDTADKEMTDKKLDSKDEKVISEYDKAHRFYMFKKAVTQAYKAITGNYPKNKDDYTFAKDMTDANPESASTIHDYLSGNNVSLNEVMRNLNLENATTKYNVPESDGSIFHEVTSAGRSGEERSDKLADWLHQDTVSAYDADAEGNFGGQFVKNLGSSTWNIIGDTVGMVANPFDSLNGLKNMVAGLGLYGSKALHDLVMGESTMEEFLAKAKPEGWWDLPNHALNAWVDPEEATATVDAMKDYLVQRYGSLEAISNTFYEDPMGFVRDVKDALRGFTGVAKKASGKAGAVLDKINELDSKYNPATKIEQGAVKGLNKTIEGVTDTSLEDIKNIPNNIKGGIEKYADKTKEAMGLLSEEERMQIQNNPYAGKQIQEAIEELNKKGDTVRPEQIYDSMVQKYVKDELVPELEKIIDNVADEGEIYGKLDRSGITLKGNDFQKIFEDILKDKNIGVTSEGKLDITKQHRMGKNSDVINDVYEQIKEISNRGTDITVDEYRTLRGLIGDEASKVGKNTDTGRLLLKLRDELNKNAHDQLPILAGLDEVFSKNSNKAKELKKGLVDKEGNVKPEAVARETKKTGKSTGLSSSEQLEELLPGHKLKMEGLNMTLNMLKKYQQGERATKSLGMAGRGAGHAIGLITGGGIGGIAGGYIGEWAGEKLGKYVLGKRDIDWNKAINEISEEGLNKLKEINNKIESKGVLTESDKAKIDKILEGIDETKTIQKAERRAATKAAREAENKAKKLEKQKLLVEEANKRFKSNYDKFRGVDEYSSLASKANSTSPFANNQFDTWKSINQQFLNRKK